MLSVGGVLPHPNYDCLGIPEADMPCAVSCLSPVCPNSMSMEPEDIIPFDAEDPTAVLASITSVKELNGDLPYTQLGEGDNRVRVACNHQLLAGCV